ncbi:response regulator [Laspinema sp. A4]|uniref:response regulator transcription factor n=1 Tax=Laspinema sp. D2d TaxID=2953686 RepID=UPI0021BB0123|nr:response regulator [Laspinema sp. D2d]MCT7983216.1 response regulator [Laspinema sp. D2d]
MASHKILVIDDSAVIRRMVRDMLPAGNFEVLEAKDGEQGLKQIREERPNLIMLDFLLPKVSGWEVFQQLEKISKTEGKMTPLVLMSGRKEEVAEKIAEPFNYFEFIEKPFEKKSLIEAIKTSMAKAKKWQPEGAPVPQPSSGGDSAAEIQALKQQMAKMQAEINALKKQMTQVVTLIKTKLK